MSGILTQIPTGEQLQFKAAEPWTVERKFYRVGTPPSNIPFLILLLDRQYFLKGSACFVRHVRQINHREAATKLSQVNIPFAAQSETLTVHWIRIWREGETIEQIDSNQALELKQSKIPDRLSAHFALKDLRPGDALDVAYSIKAITPPGHFSVTQPIRQRLPVSNWHISAIVPPGSPLECKLPPELAEAEVKELAEGSRFHRWHLKEVPAMERVQNPPSWHPTCPELQLSNFVSWAEVASEMQRTWQMQPACSKTSEIAQRFAGDAGSSLWESARRACRFVQDEIDNRPSRAITLEPADLPADVLERGAGDAKSKACLLVALLRSLGIPSAPVVVSKARKRTISDSLPSPDLFDHVIVRGIIDNTNFWIDPSAHHQAGPIEESVLPAYGSGLQVSASTGNLCTLPQATHKANQLTVTEHFKIGEDLRTTVSITSRVTGSEANEIRAIRAKRGLPDLAAERLAAFRGRFPDTTEMRELNFEDNTAANEIVIHEEFNIPKITKANSQTARFLPHSIHSKLPTEATIDPPLDHPLALEFPCNIRHLTVIDTPWGIADSESGEQLSGSGFAFSFKCKTEGRRHTLRYAYNSLDDHIAPSEFAAANAQRHRILSHLDYRIQTPRREVEVPAKAGKGSRLPKKPDQANGRNLGNKGPGKNILLPILAAAAALALVLIVRSAFKEKAGKDSQVLKDKVIAEIAARPVPEESPPLIEIPDDHRELFKPTPLLSGPDPEPEPDPESFEDLKFDIGDGEAGGKTDDGEKKNATSGDWKVGK